ncbi:MAG: hypothetical protein FJZ38_07245 [Candidatus Rokubacteria bacterium]|nr:hypothetical protein [Candidatus Rokubacteria bacterium]
MTPGTVHDEIDTLLDRVLLDGRYLDDVRGRPREIAQRLGLGLSDDAERRLAETDTGELLDHLYARTFNARTANLHPYIMGEMEERKTISIAVGIIAVVGGAVIVVGIAVVIKSERDPESIVDRSPARGQKL